MKRLTVFMFCLLALQSAIVTALNDKSKPSMKEVNALTVSSAPETETLAASWIDGFRLAYPAREVKMVHDGKESVADIHITTPGSQGFTSEMASWKMVVGRDVIVPVMSTSDPCSAAVTGHGISPEEFAMILSSGGSLTWGKLSGTDSNTPVRILIPGDNAALLALSEFTKLEPDQITAMTTAPGEKLFAGLRDKQGTIAFCRLADITDPSGTELINGIQLIPVDVNNNGKLDYFEQFYANYSSFCRGVYIGKYPKSLCNNILIVSSSIPADGAPSEFIMYLLSDGQRALSATGYTALATGEGNLRREALVSAQASVTPDGRGISTVSAWLWILAVIAAVSLLAWVIKLFTLSGVKQIEAPLIRPESPFSLRSLKAPAGILYDRSHAWSFIEKDGTVRVGIDDFMQHVTGTLSRVVMKFPGEKVRKGEHVLSMIQNGKKLAIPSPVSGTIVARNEMLSSDTGLINSSPYDAGWVYAIEPENWEKESRLMMAAGRYLDFLKEEFARMRDFLAVVPGISDVRFAHVVMQDGGEFKNGFLGEFGPEVWEEFQNRFLDTPR